jgi:hypothetical protein
MSLRHRYIGNLRDTSQRLNDHCHSICLKLCSDRRVCIQLWQTIIVCFVRHWLRHNKYLCIFMGNKYKISVRVKISARVFRRRNTCRGLKCMFVWLLFPSPPAVRSRRTDLSAQGCCVHSALTEVICRRCGNIACLRQSNKSMS